MENQASGGGAYAHASTQQSAEVQVGEKSRFVEQGEKLLKNFQKTLQELLARDSKINELDSSMKLLRNEITNLKRKNIETNITNESETSLA
jgi:hypothetical protein